MKQIIGALAFSLIFIFAGVQALLASGERFTVPIGDSPWKGPKDAPVTIIEFLDFQ